tara:strand:- start:875 stop:1336 length:462 start_codon:yes stop_codon:yes gene_type:complete
MPSKAAHVQAVIENTRTLNYLREQIEDHPQWVVTVAFYKALHVVEALFAADPQATQKHCDDHSSRSRLLKKTNRYKKIWEHYRPLFNDSLIARYLRENDDPGGQHNVFSRYLSPEEVEKTHINRNVAEILKSARKILKDPKFLQELDSPTKPK